MKLLYQMWKDACKVRSAHVHSANRQLAHDAALQKPARSTGFTLLELLIVISMMIFITTIAVMNYFGAMRSAGFTAVGNDIFNSLLMARQRACIDNKPVVFYLNDTTNFVLLEAGGTITQIINPDTYPNAPSGSRVFCNLYDDFFGSSNMTLVNMDRPGSAAGVWLVESDNIPVPGIDSSGNPTTYPVQAYKLHVTNSPPTSQWQADDRYGTSIFAPQILPKGFVFLQPAGNSVTFKPDGTVESYLQEPPLTVTEQISGKKVTFTIAANGTITQGN